MFELRPYQTEAIERIINAFAKGLRRLILLLPAGSGKTIVFCQLIKELQERAVILGHRDELIWQDKEKLEGIWPEADIGIVAGRLNQLDHFVTIASVETLYWEKRLAQLGKFPLVIVDEAHHAPAPRWRRAIEYLLDGGKLLGVTATPFRADEISLKPLFEEIVYHRSMLDLIIDGYLADGRGIQIRTEEDLDQVKVLGGDFVESSLSEKVNTPSRNKLIVRAYQKYGEGRPFICYTVDVAHAETLTEEFQRVRINAETISGKTPFFQRRRKISAYKAGLIDGFNNCEVLTEGTDLPMASCVIMGRPTQSDLLYRQMVGRGSRLWFGKKDFIVLDITDNTSKHNLISFPELFETSYEEIERVKSERKEREKAEAQLSILEFKKLVAKRVDLFRAREFQWVQLGDGNTWALSIGEGFINIIPSISQPNLYDVLYLPRDGEGRKLHEKPLRLDWAYGLVGQEAQKILKGRIDWLRKDAPWRDLPATSEQIRLLENMVKDRRLPLNLSRGEASAQISKYFAEKAKPTEEQLARIRTDKEWLERKLGKEIHLESLTRKEASSLLDIPSEKQLAWIKTNKDWLEKKTGKKINSELLNRKEASSLLDILFSQCPNPIDPRKIK